MHPARGLAPGMSASMDTPEDKPPAAEQPPPPAEARPTRLRFKQRRRQPDDSSSGDYIRRSRYDSDESTKEEGRSEHKPSHRHVHRRHHHHHHRGHRSKRRKQEASGKDAPDACTGLDPDAAFRESLFDAMADDEGADYWEGIYGQPIHTYSSVRMNEERGELERMDEDEYVAHVRARMWEKTHEHVIEERVRREEAARRQKESRQRTAQMERDKTSFDREMEESLRRGVERKRAKLWADGIQRYHQGWEAFTTAASAGTDAAKLKIPWPVKSGEQRDVERDQVHEFFRELQSHGGQRHDRRTLLKLERVRWHPDKMQQRFGAQTLDKGTLRAVTMVFQVVDGMWTQAKDSS